MPTFSGQLKACTSWRLSTSIIAPAFPPKRPIFSTFMSLCCTCLCARVLFFDRCLLPGCTHSHAHHHHPCVPVCPLLSVDRCPAQSRKSPSTPSPLAQTRDHPHIVQLTFLTLRDATQAEPSLSSGSLHQQQNCRVALRLLVQPLPASAWAGWVRRGRCVWEKAAVLPKPKPKRK